MSKAYADLLRAFPDKDHQRFVKDMQKAGVQVGIYSARGAFGKEVPCAYTDDEHDEQSIYGATKVALKRDSLGKRYVLYP